MAAGINERTWLEWLVKVRIIIITVLFAIELAIINLTVTNVNRPLLRAVIVGWYLSAAVYLYLAPSRKNSGAWRSGAPQSAPLQSKLQVITDLCFSTALIYVTGGIDTTFVFLYPILIIVASALLSATWAYLTAGASFVLFGAILELSYFDLIPSYSTNRPDLKTLQAIVSIYLVAFAAIAYLANKLVSRMREAEVELKDKSFELENLQVLHQIIVSSISGGLITTDLDFAIRLVNPAAQALLGWGAGEYKGRRVHQLFLDPLPSPSQPRCEVRAQTPAGSQIYLGIGCSQLNGTDGATLGYIYTFTDLTQIRHLERELRQRDRLAAVGRLASGIAHEIRNPLASIAGSVTMLAGIATLTEDQRALLGIVTRESERLNAIITDFLAYSRDRHFQSARVDLCQLLSDALTLLENQQSSIKIERHISPEAMVDGDADKLKQVFWNLSSNALRAMPNGGTLAVSLDDYEGQRRVRFQDTGTGIPSHLMEKVFEPFQSGFEGGTGLGLAIVYRIVQAHGAKISVKSEPGQGTMFTLLFRPAEPGSPASAAGSLPQASVGANSIRVEHDSRVSDHMGQESR